VGAGRNQLAQDQVDAEIETFERMSAEQARNASRFPADFAFVLTTEEVGSLRSQIGISKTRGGRRHSSTVFTEQGVAMLSSVLRSRRAIDVNIAITRAFVQLREMLTSHKDLARRIDELELKYDGNFSAVFAAMSEPSARMTLFERGRDGCCGLGQRRESQLGWCVFTHHPCWVSVESAHVHNPRQPERRC
jgi:hypothetical protein